MIEFGEMRIILGVKSNGELIGHIRFVQVGWQYFARGDQEGGEIFPTLDACKRSLL